jgi:NAD(P)H dehydrogenase (quinone)
MAEGKDGPALLVTGAGGKLGRRVVDLLLESGKKSVIATTRTPDKLADLASRGVDVRKADFDDQASLEKAFAGADRLLLVSTDALDRPARRLDQHRAAIAAAERAGVRHVLYTSAPAPHPAPRNALIDSHFWTEQALIASKLEWTILRDNIYAEIALMGLMRAATTGELVSAVGDGARSYVTREDCARVAAAALAVTSGRQILDVTGPTAVTQAELAAIASELAGRPIKPVTVDPEELRKGLAGAGLPSPLVEGLVDFDIAAARGYHAIVTPTVKALTGRDPTPIRAFLATHATALTQR